MVTSKTKPTAKMVMIYAHADRNFLQHSQMLYFLEGLASEEGFEFWWDREMDHPLWDEEIKRRLDEADIVVCLVSQPFLNSDYVKNVEAPRTYRRLIREGIMVVPIMVDASTWKQHKWLSKLHHFPDDKTYLRGRRNRGKVYLDIVEYIRKWFRGSLRPYQDPRMIYTLRLLPATELNKQQLRILTNDSCKKAREMVKDEALREKIIKSARELKKIDKNKPLGKQQLAQLDKKFLAGKRRKPDPEVVRWVLRCAQLHPQGKA